MAKPYVSYPRRRRNSLPLPLLTLGVLVLGLVGSAFVLHATGAMAIPFLSGQDEPPPGPDLTGLVRVPRTARAVPAYAAVSRDDVWDAREQAVSVVYLRPEDVGPEILIDLGRILGRVLKREKPAGYVFTEADFYPEGTRPGPTAGVPPGKRAMRLKATDMPGLHGLNQGDHFDIVMTVPVEFEKPPLRAARADDGLEVEGPYAGARTAELSRAAEEVVRVKRKHADVRTIVHNGVVVMPVHQRKEISMATSLLRGSSLQTTPVEELIIAVEPEEVAALNQALAVEAQLHVAMRSGRVEEVDEGRIPDLAAQEEDLSAPPPPGEEAGGLSLVEVIAGAEKQIHAVPRPLGAHRGGAVGGGQEEGKP